MRVLVLGASGQLGQCLRLVAERRSLDFLVFPEESSANILDVDALSALFAEVKPSFVINCAAYTAVDKAESDVEVCRAVNRDGALSMARLCAEHGAAMVHISTDFVFEGDVVELLREEDMVEPISVYGLTKLEGELAIAEVLPEHFILRTSWLYSEFGNNFVKTMLKLGADRDELNIIADQIGSPTYAIDLAGAILDIIAESGPGARHSERSEEPLGRSEEPPVRSEESLGDYGLYHYSNEGAVSWYDFAKAIFELSATQVKVNPIPSSDYPTAAKRPKFSVMDKSKIKSAFGLEVPYWRDSLMKCIEALKL